MRSCMSMARLSPRAPGRRPNERKTQIFSAADHIELCRSRGDGHPRVCQAVYHPDRRPALADGLAVANGRLFVSTDRGGIYSFSQAHLR